MVPNAKVSYLFISQMLTVTETSISEEVAKGRNGLKWKDDDTRLRVRRSWRCVRDFEDLYSQVSKTRLT